MNFGAGAIITQATPADAAEQVSAKLTMVFLEKGSL
jgi:hypothetical protein